jgi:hypothetical protein
MSRSRSGLAEAKCCSNSSAGSTLCGAAIAGDPLSSSLVGTQKDHAVAVSHHDTTPLTNEKLVHHLRGRNRLVRSCLDTKSLVASAVAIDRL